MPHPLHVADGHFCAPVVFGGFAVLHGRCFLAVEVLVATILAVGDVAAEQVGGTFGRECFGVLPLLLRQRLTFRSDGCAADVAGCGE